MHTPHAIADMPPTITSICPLEPTLWNWANIYKASATIFALNELGVLPLLASSTLTAEAVATRLGLAPHLLRPLLELLTVLGVLTQNGDAFHALPSTEAILPLITMEAHISATHINSAQIARVLRSGLPASIFDAPGAAEYIPVFAAAMRSSARTLAPHLVRFGEIRRCRRILDLGGADGSLALALRRVAPHINITVADLPRMESVFRKQVAEHCAEDALDFWACDLSKPESIEPLLASADAVIASNVIHLLPTESRMALYRTIRLYGKPGSRLLLYDQFNADPLHEASGALSATEFLAVDWVVNGVQFRETPQEVCNLLTLSGYSSACFKRFSGLPGALVSAIV